ncbi:hypothetical protein ISS21_00845 [Patescibacteria group bacterium]|nr:hypothetical protein [Patescibacteria group bacterium]
MRKYLRGYTINYLSRRLVDRCRPEPCNFWVHEEKIFENKPALDYFTPIVQLLVIGLEFVKECREQPDRVWIILNHIGNEHINVERKTNALNPKLKYLVYERRQGEGLSAADFNTVILPCFKAIIRDLMGVGKN